MLFGTMHQLLLLTGFLASLLHPTVAGPTQLQATWDQQRDDPSEYGPPLQVAGARDLTDCLVRGSGNHHGAQFDESSGVCQLLACKFGDRGCRKCRHAQNTSLPVMWVKRLDQVRVNCWRTIQHRVDDTVNFTRNWADYAQGFGSDANKNYWIGLVRISALTYPAFSPLRIEMKLWNGSFVTMEYSSFAVAPMESMFTMLSLGSFSSYPGSYDPSGITSCVGSNFSTYDADNDKAAGVSCALDYKAGWWYTSCHNANPNGVYYNLPEALSTPNYADGIVWNPIAGYFYSMQEIEFMIG